MDYEQAAVELIWNVSCLQLPIGVYFVAPDGRFLACNGPLRALLHLPLEGAVEASIADFYAEPGRRDQLLAKALEADARGQHLQKELIHFRVNGADMFVENFCKPLRDPATQTVAGYVGCLVDVTAEHEADLHQDELQQKVQELTIDIGRVLHANTTTLIMAQQTLDAVEEVLSGSPFDLIADAPPVPGQNDGLLIDAAARLADAIDRLVQAGDEERRLKTLPAAKWALLVARAEFLRQVQDRIQLPEMRLPVLRKAAHQVAEICLEAQPKALSREVVRTTQQAAAQLERLVCLIDVVNTRSTIVQMDYTLRALRDFVTSDVRDAEPPELLSVGRLIEQAIMQLAAFAKSSNIEIVLRDRAPDAQVEGVERDLLRALTNLLHNAIKYTWARQRAGSPWVTIRTTVQDRMVCVEFENWGVPIARDELKKDLIFQLGYRGMWSTDRGRLGTGIGLTDARRVAEAHKGALRAQSKPASPSLHSQEDTEYYKQPFVTTFSLCLPLAAGDRHKG
jgi:signal transduction histidine kinase